MYPEYHFQGFSIYTDPAKADVTAIQKFLANDSYWAQEIPEEIVARSLQNSLCFSLFYGASQIGLARVITDKATFAYLSDVYVLPEFRGKGLSKWLMKCVQEHPDLQNIRKFMLATKDAQGLYAQFGFKPVAEPGRIMEILNRDIYKNLPETKNGRS